MKIRFLGYDGMLKDIWEINHEPDVKDPPQNWRYGDDAKAMPGPAAVVSGEDDKQ